MFEVDVLGLACPIPVVRVQKAMATHAGEKLLVKVDGVTPKEHVTRLAESKGYRVVVNEHKGEIHLELTPCP
ncbi:MAG: sulfurtransferase TusA family protein [Dehalococcoidia bacterium]|nr:sulfurtransferase TusA family protein [Dehalococcoidia bacterium]